MFANQLLSKVNLTGVPKIPDRRSPTEDRRSQTARVTYSQCKNIVGGVENGFLYVIRPGPRDQESQVR